MIEETLTRIAVALEAIAAKPPVLIMTAPAAGGGQSLTGVGEASDEALKAFQEAAAPDTVAAAPVTRGKGKKTLNAAEAAKLAEAHAAIDKEAAEKAANLAAMPPLPGKPAVPAAPEVAATATMIPDDMTMKQAVIALLGNSKRPQAVKILEKYGCSNASAVPAEHRVQALKELLAAAAA